MSAVGLARAAATAPARLPAVPLRLRLDGYRACLFALTVMTFSRIHQHYEVLRAMRPALLLVVLAGAFALLDRRTIRVGAGFRQWPMRLTFALAALACLSAPFGLSLGSSGAFILTDYSKTILYAVLVLLALRDARDLHTFVWAYLAGVLVLAWIAFFLFDLTSNNSLADRLGRLYSWDGNDVGLIMVVALPLALLAYQTSGRAGKLFSALTMIAVVVTIGRTGSRGAFVGTLASGVALLLTATSVSLARRVGSVLAIAVALVAFAPRGYWAQMNTMADITDDYNWNALDGRRQIAERGFHYMWNHPAFGVGINNFSRAECLDPDSPKVRFHVTGTGLRCTAPHNSIVQAGAELGIPGLILWLTMICGGVVGMFRLRGRLPKAWANGTPEEQFLHRLPLYLGVAMVGFAVSSTFVGFAWLDLVYFLAALMSGAYAVTLQRTGAPPARYRSEAARRSAELVERFRATQIRSA